MSHCIDYSSVLRHSAERTVDSAQNILHNRKRHRHVGPRRLSTLAINNNT